MSLCMCLHATVYVSSYYFMRVLMRLCVLILAYVCPHTTTCVCALLTLIDNRLYYRLCYRLY
jgi:hypothetical protein